MKKIIIYLILTVVLLTGCAKDSELADGTTNQEKTTIQVFAAASLKNVMENLAAEYEKVHPEADIICSADSSGTLMTQIEEGYACDIFFSAAQKQMDELEEKDFLIPDTRKNVVNNQVVVIAAKGAETEVTGLGNIGRAKSIALADGSVPVGRYTRAALLNMGLLTSEKEPAAITTAEVSEAFNGVEISEQSNVSKVLMAVTEGSCEVGTVYYSDTFGYEEDIEILDKVSYDLTGDVIYPIAAVKNDEADAKETAAAKEFLDYVTADENKPVFEKYYFDTNVE